jgi:hypothetical protein
LAGRRDRGIQARLRDAAVLLRWEIEQERLLALYDRLAPASVASRHSSAR